MSDLWLFGAEGPQEVAAMRYLQEELKEETGTLFLDEGGLTHLISYLIEVGDLSEHPTVFAVRCLGQLPSNGVRVPTPQIGGEVGYLTSSLLGQVILTAARAGKLPTWPREAVGRGRAYGFIYEFPDVLLRLPEGVLPSGNALRVPERWLLEAFPDVLVTPGSNFPGIIPEALLAFRAGEHLGELRELAALIESDEGDTFDPAHGLYARWREEDGEYEFALSHREDGWFPVGEAPVLDIRAQGPTHVGRLAAAWFRIPLLCTEEREGREWDVIHFPSRSQEIAWQGYARVSGATETFSRLDSVGALFP